MQCDKIRETLLKSDEFIDNVFLENYIQLINEYQDYSKEKFVTQKHHIIPVHYYEYLGIDVDNSEANLVNLPIIEHVKAHYFLLKCSKGKTYYANLSALVYMLHIQRKKLNITDSFEDFIVQYPDYVDMYKDWIKEQSRIRTEKNMGENNPMYGKHVTEEAKAKQRAVLQVKFLGERNPFYGHKHSAENIEKWRHKVPWNKGHTSADDPRIKLVPNKPGTTILQYDLNGNFIKEYLSARLAVREALPTVKHTANLLTHIKKFGDAPYHGYIWKIKTVENECIKNRAAG